MPELPEVQTTINGLSKNIVGRTFVSAWSDWVKFKPIHKAVGHVVMQIVRRGKNILIYLNHDKILLIHQKMTGHLLIGKWDINGKKVAPAEPEALKERINSYIHFILTLNNSKMLGFSDLRKFGKVIYGSTKKVEQLAELQSLGPDALDPDFTFEDFSRRIRWRKKAIYQVLMDQAVLAGVGNIYASEVLYAARVYPFKLSNKLKEGELRALWQQMRKILAHALKLRGTSAGDYRDTAGEEGGYYRERLVYDREHQACYECGTRIKRTKRAGRSAYYCPRCQKH